MWENVVERGRAQMAIWSMRIECWITQATNAHSEHVIIIAFPRQQWLRERASLLRVTYLTVHKVTLGFKRLRDFRRTCASRFTLGFSRVRIKIGCSGGEGGELATDGLRCNHSVVTTLTELFRMFSVIPHKHNFNHLNPSGHYMYRTVVTICTA